MNRDDSRFARVYDQHVWRVYAAIAYRVRNDDLAEDLTQETFERALRAWARFDARKASEVTWLLTIANNVMIDHHRRRRVTDELGEETAVETTPGPEQSFDGSPDMVEALGVLSDREREVVGLRFAADLTGAEIAAVLDLSVANVQQILSRSLRKLRVLLEGTELGATRRSGAVGEP
jgi:RNA polymerase sigma factor (sigma-70 family)